MRQVRFVHGGTAVVTALMLGISLTACGAAEPAAAPSASASPSTSAAATTTSSPEELAAWVTDFCTAIAQLGTIAGAPAVGQIDQTSVDTILGSLGQYYLDASALATTASTAVAGLGQVPLNGAQGFQRNAASDLELTADQYLGLQLELGRVDTSNETEVIDYISQVDATEPLTIFALARLRGAVPELKDVLLADPNCGVLVLEVPS